MAAETKTDPALKRAMADSLKAYSAGSKKFFEYLRDDVRVYNLNSAEPMVGRKRFESAFAETLAKTKRTVKVVHSDLQGSRDQAVLAQTLEITSDDVALFVRQTVIWSRDGKGRWRMAHIHNALVGNPVAVAATKGISSARAVRVLNERIATVAAAVGVAQ